MSGHNLPIEELIPISGHLVSDEFNKHRRHLLHKASSEQLLALKLELHEVLGLVELHSRPENDISRWFQERAAGLLAYIDEEVIFERRKGWNDI